MVISFWNTILVTIGLILVIMPDQEKSVFNFNKDHGPSLQDAVGLMLIVLGWCFILFKIIFKQKMVLKFIGQRNTVLLTAMIVGGSIFIIGGLKAEKDSILWIGTLFSVVGYSALLIPAFRRI
ncbi:MAG: hypothetical protein ABI663_00950 [Chryseolinea sp.]